jgi:alpha,alpha-trehalase
MIDRRAGERAGMTTSKRPAAKGAAPAGDSPDVGPVTESQRRESSVNAAEAPSTTGSPFPTIGDYAFLSDCHVNALVAPGGGIEWMCAPRPDSPSVFAAMLDRSAGSFRLGPEDQFIPAGRRYIPGTNVLETTWQTPTGWLLVHDFLAMGPWYHTEHGGNAHRRTPDDWDSEHMLIRVVRCLQGELELSLDCEPVFDYGRHDAHWEYAGDGYGQATASAAGTDLVLTVTTSLRLGFETRRASARTRLHEGETAFVALSWADHPPPTSYEQAYAAMQRTEAYWREWLSRGQFPDHPWRSFLQRSALVLKGLTYMPTGALLAAATTSLPETPHGERNWDYRYSWVRDATFTLWGLYTLGFDHEANDFFSFIADVCRDHPDLQVMYGVGGERQLDESTLDHLHGYEGARPVRIGNAAYQQQQNDVWGSFLDSVYLHTKSRDYLPEQVWPIVVRQVEDALANWRNPDQGIWEVRGEPQHFVSSKLMCWVAVDRGARLAELREDDEQAKAWRKEAGVIHADILAHGLDERGVFTQYYGSTSLDASALLLPLFRFLPADDKRIRATVMAIADELRVDGMVKRYVESETDDGMTGQEGAFAICSFWLVSAMAEIGELRRATELCEKLLSYASPLQLFAEEIDPRTGRMLGNFPQAFTHLALINAVMHVIRG